MAETIPILLTREQAAKRLGLSTRMLAALIRDDFMAETRIYGVSRISVDEIDRIAREGTNPSHKPHNQNKPDTPAPATEPEAEDEGAKGE